MDEVTKYCPRCGQLETNLNVKKCMACGALLEEGTLDERAVYIGGKTSDKNSYLRIFDKMKALGKKTSWNWWGFLFPTYWMAYRKMYGWAAISYVANLVVIFVGWTAVVMILPSLIYVDTYDRLVSIFLQLPVRIVVGVLSNYLYMRKIDKLILERNQLPDHMHAAHEKRGGTSVIAVIVALAVVGAVSVINTLITM